MTEMQGMVDVGLANFAVRNATRLGQYAGIATASESVVSMDRSPSGWMAQIDKDKEPRH